ncbi:putative cytokinetic ring protein SteA [Nocardioides sp. CFH 31398]|uniref:putative cytokinetic ring protein SteA n=1 Tax=Nocardioides sp. CFH 31398 TaxID=2919579 RepID=UPI001F06D239|nr:putative cytokinetic ring protein SteA [Nocardioides sp. CFH 31398]MCH1867034.1 putative cytokinetic ring protein SteA [Nocardioides sp. CFH 31398]
MRLPVRTRRPDTQPGLTGRARVVGRTAGRREAALRGLRRGEVLVLERTDLDRATAQAAIDAGAAAVVNASSSISGRYPTLGAGLLADAGVVHLDRVGVAVLDAVRDGTVVRIHEGRLHVEGSSDADGAASSFEGRVLDASSVVDLQARARTSMSAHLESLTLHTGEFLKREHRLLLHGAGLPDPTTSLAGRPVVVVAAGHEHRAELRAVRAFVREQRPVVIGVDTGAVVATDVGMKPDVVVVSAPGDDRGLPPAAVLRHAGDVVLVEPRGGSGGSGTATADTADRLARLGLTPLTVRTSATPEDTALLLAHHRGASAVVGVGMHATLEELLDGERPGLGSTHLTRLEIGPRLVDAAALPGVYAGRVGLRHVVGVLLVGLLALLAAILVTPVGQEWAAAAVDAVAGLVRTLVGAVR